MTRTYARPVSIPRRLILAAVLLSGYALLACPHAGAAPAPIWRAAALEPSAVFAGAMTTSSTYAGGKEADSELDALAPRLVYPNSQWNALWGGSSDRVTYTITIPTAGNWYLWGRFYYPNAPGGVDGNSFFVRMDSGLRSVFGNAGDRYQRWHWGGDGNVTKATPRALKLGYLTAGTHKLLLEKREVRTIPPRLDVFVLTMDAAFVPTDALAAQALNLTPGGNAAAFTVTPTTMNFGKLAVGKVSAPISATITNTGKTALTVSALAIGGTNPGSFSVNGTGFTLQPGAKSAVGVTFKPQGGGVRKATLEISTSAGKGLVILTGEGIATATPAKLQIAPTSVALGSVNVGTTSAATSITLANTGGSEMTVSTVSVAGSHAAEFTLTAPAMPLRVAPQAKATLTVKYAPTHAGTCQASLSVTSTGSSTPVVVQMTGTGVSETGSGGGNGENDNSTLGANLNGLNDWSPEWSFIDAFKMSREWMSSTDATWDDGRQLAVDADGWVKSLQAGQYARTLVFWDLPDMYPAGDYIVLYDGQGVLEYSFAATKDTARSAAHRDVLRVDPSQGGFCIMIRQTNPADYIRNIRVIMPGGMSPSDPYTWYKSAAECPTGDYQSFEQCYQSAVFHPVFMKSLRKYRAVRFMDWMRTNGSPLRNWSDRAKPSNARYTTEKGAPLEVMISLCNKLQADGWFCLPHQGTDDYFRQFATMLKAQLSPDLLAYVEYSNEVWNWMFAQTQYASDQGVALGLHSDKYQAVFYYCSLRSMQLAQIVEQVYGGELDRAVRILGAQADGWYWSEEMLKYRNAYQHFDAMAIAPYFGGGMGGSDRAGSVQNMTLDQAFAEINNNAIPEAITSMQMQAEVCGRYGVSMVAYEGGQHLVGTGGAEDNDALNSLFDRMNRDSRMGTAYTNYLNGWKQAGGSTFIHYVNCCTYTKWGRWGAMEHLLQPRSQAPKFDALQRFIENNQ